MRSLTPPFSRGHPQHLGRLIRVVPIRQLHSLELLWPVPPTEPLYATQPTQLLSHLLGHEGAGSAFALLKERGWATALSAGESGGGFSGAGGSEGGGGGGLCLCGGLPVRANAGGM